MQVTSIGSAALPAQRTGDKPANAPVAPPAEALGATPAAAATPAQTAEAVAQPSPRDPASALKQALQDINETMRTLSRDLEFSVDTDSGQVVVKVVDKETNEIIRQMPSKEALEIARALDKVQGLLIRQSA